MVAPLKKADDEETQALCSLCYEGCPVPDTFIMPHFNEYVHGFVTTYRCPKCAPVSFAETRAKLLTTTDRRDIDSCGEFFGRYGVPVLEHVRGDKIDKVRAALLALVERLESRDLTLAIGPAVPLDPELLKLMAEGGLAPPRG